VLSRGRRILIEWLAIAALATAALAMAVSADLFRRADHLIYDRLIRLEQQPARDDIIIVAIDDESMRRIGRFPWPREVHARLLDRLAAARPRALIYDVLFVEPAPGDAALARSVAASRPILPLYMEVPGRNGASVDIVLPEPALRSAGALVGHVNLSPDEDGIVRGVHLAEGTSDRLWPHVGALTACRAAHIACAVPERSGGTGLIRRQPFLIPFAGGRQHFRTVPFAAVLDGSVPDAFFRDRIVLVGATASGLSDTYATPMASRDALMPGVEVNANVVQALLSGRAITPARGWARQAIALLPLWLLLCGFLFARPRFNLLLGIGLALLVIAASLVAMPVAGIWISPVAALVGLIVVYPLWGWRRLQATSSYMHEELERFRHDPGLNLAGERRAAEPVQSDIELLRSAIARARDLQHFVTDTLKGLPDASLVLSLDGSVRMLNDRGRALLGNVEGRHFSAVLAKLEGKAPEPDPAPSPGPDATPAEMTDRRGRIFDIRWSPIRSGGPDPVAWVLRLADVSDLRIAMRQREEALQLLTHDMRSPQASIIAALSQADGAIEPPLARRIEGYARRTLELADGFVQLARAEAQPLAAEEVNLADLVLDAVDDLWPLSSARQIRIETSGCESEVLVRGDRALLTRAIINLVGNAIKYGPASAVIHCRLGSDGTFGSIEVCDQGPGLTEEQIATLFQPFRQVGRNSAEGAGLGLAFVRSVATRHGGSVGCRSTPGKGSCFELRLPASGSV
jgi:CHASE2 domain-containing sensor protein